MMARLISLVISRQIDQVFLLGACISLVAIGLMLPLSVTGTDIAVVVAASLSLLSGIVFRSGKEILHNPLTIPIIIFVVLVTLGMFWSIAPWTQRLSALHKYSKLLYIPLLLPLCKGRWRDYAINAFLLSMMMTVILSLLKAYTVLKFGKVAAPSWVFHNHIETSYFVAFSAYLVIDRALQSSRSWYWRAFYGVLAVLFTYQEFFINDGRTGWLVYFCLILLFVIQRLRPDPLSATPQSLRLRFKNITLGMFLGTISVFLIGLLPYEFSNVFRANADETLYAIKHQISFTHLVGIHPLPQATGEGFKSVEPRINFLGFSLSLIKQHPIMGLGSGSFKTAYQQAGGIPGSYKHLDTPHNEYLLVMVQLGVLGFAALLWIFYTQASMTPYLGEFRRPAQALLVSYLVGCVFNAFLFTMVAGYFYVLFSSVFFAEKY
ncbi:MAG: O-antigen ligase family protein [Gammaproteobacteria bacterium]